MSIKYALIGLLAEEPKFGLQLKNEFEAYTGEVWPLNVGQVYTTLKRLVRDGWVEPIGGDSEDSQAMYQLVDTGRAALDDWLREFKDDTPPRDELVIKILIALSIPGVDIASVIQSQRRKCIERMQQYTKLKVGDESLSLNLAADAEIFRLEALVRWLDMAEVKAKKMKPVSKPKVVESTMSLKSEVAK